MLSYVKRPLLTVLLLLFSTTLYAEDKLIFALDLIRHGDRTPLQTIPNAPHTWSEGLGELTPLGMRQELDRGVAFRKKYIERYHLLPARFENRTVYVASTNFDRTLMSAEAALLGLYPLGSGPSLPRSDQPALSGGYQPVPIHADTVNTTDVFISDADPVRFNQLLAQYVYTRPDWQAKTAAYKAHFAAWSRATGIPITSINQIDVLADTLHIYQLHHVAAPAELSEQDIKEIIALGMWSFAAKYRTKEIAAIVGSPLLAMITDYIQQASQHKTPLKYVLLSAHDSTIMSLMTTLQNPLDSQPPYASDLNFELFKTTAGYEVKVIYNDQPVALPGCGAASCTLEQFRKLSSFG